MIKYGNTTTILNNQPVDVKDSDVYDNYRTEKINFLTIRWDKVSLGQEVFLKGTHLGNFRAYGPHWVEDVKKRKLVNSRDITFLHYSEDLLVKV